jgi:hypothetical protein
LSPLVSQVIHAQKVEPLGALVVLLLSWHSS